MNATAKQTKNYIPIYRQIFILHVRVTCGRAKRTKND